MELFIIRHSLPELSDSGCINHDPALSHDGRDYLKHCIQKWKAQAISFDMLLTSPMKRTMQTAELICHLFSDDVSPGLSPIACDSIALTSSLADGLAVIQRYTQLDRLGLVTHQPVIDALVSHYVDRHDSIVGYAALVRIQDVETEVPVWGGMV